MLIFQSTLPRGSDSKEYGFRDQILISIHAPSRERQTLKMLLPSDTEISIHAPSRERLYKVAHFMHYGVISIHAPSRERLRLRGNRDVFAKISIHAPSRERQHQNKLLLYSFKSSIFCELAQLKYSKIYFDVRKLIVSHSSLSCEPKLNFMFHITSHRIILHYFYSCQSICK